MPAAKPTQASITNVIKAIESTGHKPGKVTVDGDGGFSVEIDQSGLGSNGGTPSPSPPKWPAAAE